MHKKNGFHSNHIDQFYKLFCRAHKFAYAENVPLANNRISNVWIMVSQCYKKKRRANFPFSIAPIQPAWPQICAADHRGLNVVTIYFMFFSTRLVGKHCPWLSRVQFFLLLYKYSNDFVGFSATKKKSSKKTARRERSSGKQNKWNNYTVRYWIELNMHTYYYLLLLLLLYYFYFERQNPSKKAP